MVQWNLSLLWYCFAFGCIVSYPKINNVVLAFNTIPHPIRTPMIRRHLPCLDLQARGDDAEHSERTHHREKEQRRHEERPHNNNNNNNNNRRSQQKPRNLNSEIFTLRKKRNGVALAERRLNEAITYMIETRGSCSDAAERLMYYPDEVTFNAILTAYGKNAKRDAMAAQKAEQLLRRMIDLSSTYQHLRPTIYSYNAVLECYAVGCTSKNRRRKTMSQFAISRLFEELSAELTPNTLTYSLVLESNDQESRTWQSIEEWVFDFCNGIDDTSIVPDRRTFHTLLKCYIERGKGDKAEELLNHALQLSDRSNEMEPGSLASTIIPSHVWANMVLKALAKNQTIMGVNEQNDARIERQAENLLQKMYRLYDEGSTTMHPNTSTYNHILNIYAASGNTEKAEVLVQDLEQKYYRLNDESLSRNDNDDNDKDNINIRPDLFTYATLIKAYSKRQIRYMKTSDSISEEMAEKAINVLQKMDDLVNDGWTDLSPNIVTYNTVLSILVRVGTREAMTKAMNIYSEMCTRNDNNTDESSSSLPDSQTYATLIHGWSKGFKCQSRVPEAGYRAEQFLHAMENLPKSRIKNGHIDRTIIYNSVIKAWSRSWESVSAQRVDALYAQLEGKFLSGQQPNCRVDKITFLSIIDTYAKARIVDAEERCEVLLQRMKYLQYEYGLDDLEPDRTIYNAILNALAKSCQPRSVEKAEEILTMMQTSTHNKRLRPDIVTYSTLIDVLTKAGCGPERAEELLRFVEGSYRAGDVSLEPNAVFYSAILQAWAKTATIDGATKAENLLRRNIALYEQGYMYAKPHAILYNAVMDALARTGEVSSGKRAEELLNEMESLYQSGDEEMKPNRRSYNAVMLAYRNEGDGGKKAEEILQRMEELSSSSTSLSSSSSSSSSYDDDDINNNNNNNNKSPRYELRPDVVSYNCAIGAIVEDSSGDIDSAADRAQALLDRMEERNIRPDGRTYSPVIEAWLKRNDEKGYALAEMMLKQFLDKVEANKEYYDGEPLYEDAVWDVVNAYRRDKKPTTDSNPSRSSLLPE